MNTEDGWTTRVDRINKAGKADHFMPTDLSKVPKEEVQKLYGNHPLEQYEQIMNDLIIKGAMYTKEKQKAMRNYLRQTHIICDNCTYPDYSLADAALGIQKVGTTCLKSLHHNSRCRVFQFRNGWKRVLSNIHSLEWYRKQEREKVFVKRNVLRGLWKNRWNWKKRTLDLLNICDFMNTTATPEEVEKVRNDIHKIPEDKTSE
jgi:uncharacterized protein YeeX (DUF496 family)